MTTASPVAWMAKRAFRKQKTSKGKSTASYTQWFQTPQSTKGWESDGVVSVVSVWLPSVRATWGEHYSASAAPSPHATVVMLDWSRGTGHSFPRSVGHLDMPLEGDDRMCKYTLTISNVVSFVSHQRKAAAARDLQQGLSKLSGDLATGFCCQSQKLISLHPK